MVKVIVSEHDDLERALRKFKRKMIRSGLFRDMKRKRYYEKPSEIKRRKARANERRRRRSQRSRDS